MHYTNDKKKGFGLVEVVIGSAIIVTGIVALIGTYFIYLTYALAHDKDVQAAYIAEEGIEAMTYLRDYGWDTSLGSMNAGTTYYLSWNGTQWSLTTTPHYLDSIFLRKIVVSNVSRDQNDRIAASGTNDPNTKLVMVTVEYHQNQATTSKSLSTYLSKQ